MDEDKVKLELDLPKDQVSLHSADDSDAVQALEEERQKKREAREELKKTRQQLIKTRKERDELKEKQEDSEDESVVKQATGYELGELVSAPLHPPEPEAKKKPVRGQVRSLIIGFALMPVALIALAIFGGTVAISVALVGAVLIALGVLVRI